MPVGAYTYSRTVFESCEIRATDVGVLVCYRNCGARFARSKLWVDATLSRASLAGGVVGGTGYVVLVAGGIGADVSVVGGVVTLSGGRPNVVVSSLPLVPGILDHGPVSVHLQALVLQLRDNATLSAAANDVGQIMVVQFCPPFALDDNTDTDGVTANYGALLSSAGPSSGLSFAPSGLTWAGEALVLTGKFNPAAPPTPSILYVSESTANSGGLSSVADGSLCLFRDATISAAFAIKLGGVWKKVSLVGLTLTDW